MPRVCVMRRTTVPKDSNIHPAPIYYGATNRLFGIAASLPGLLVLVLSASLTFEARASAESESKSLCPPSGSQSVWIISTRNAPLCNPGSTDASALEYWRMDIDEDGCRRWTPSDKDEFHASSQPDVPTCFHIHGNRTMHHEAISESLCVLKCLENQAEGRKFRMVTWSWPSTRIQGPNRKDARVKAARSDVQAYYLARFLRRMNTDTHVGMIGYSFGARIITGALEMLAGGRVAGRRLDAQAESAEGSTPGGLPEMRIVLVASATDRCWLLPGRRNGSALDLVDWALITRNGNDPVLRWYPKMYGCSGPQAAGFTGPALTGRQLEKTEVLNLSCSVGKSHDWQRYLHSSGLYWRLGECVFAEQAVDAQGDSVEE